MFKISANFPLKICYKAVLKNLNESVFGRLDKQEEIFEFTPLEHMISSYSVC